MPSPPTPRAFVITLLNLKGGVGKTHAAWLLAAVAVEQGKRMLLIDVDPQGNLSGSFVEGTPEKSTSAVLFDPRSEVEALALVQKTSYSGLELLPASSHLARFDHSDQLVWEKADLHLSLVDAVSSLRPHYDFIVFDCPPRLSLVSFAALCASDGVIVPLEAADWGAQGIAQVTAAIEYVRTRFHPGLTLLGYLVSRFKVSRSYQRSYLAQLRAHFGPRAFDTIIPDVAAFEKSVTDRIPITRHAPKSRAAYIAREFFAEVERGDAPKLSGAALAAADRTFRQTPSLPLSDSLPPSPGAEEGRQRLQGAFSIELRRIRPDPTQPRRSHDEGALIELTRSILRHGVLQPISVRYLPSEDFYQIISGERRFRAAVAAGFEQIPCWLQSPKDEEILVRQVVENWQRAQLHPYELADALGRLRDENRYTQRQLAEATGKSEGEISKLLSLLDLAPDLQKETRETQGGSITKRHLYAITRLPEAKQASTLQAVKQGNLSSQETEKLVSRSLDRPRGGKKAGAPVTRFRYATSEASVLVTFRRQTAGAEDVLKALDEARRKIVGTAESIKIVRIDSKGA